MNKFNPLAPERQIKVMREIPQDLSSHFVQHFVVQHREDHFILSCFEVWPPIIVGATEDEVAQQLSDLTSIPAKCVARLVLTPSKMEELMNIMIDNFERFRSHHQLLSEE